MDYGGGLVVMTVNILLIAGCTTPPPDSVSHPLSKFRRQSDSETKQRENYEGKIVTKASRLKELAGAATTGAAAGLAGAAVMVVGEKLEQAVTHRPNSYVPARTLLTLLGQHPGDDAKPMVWNHLMHYGTGAALGALRGIWAVTGIRGAHANLWHTVIRLGFDQTIENSTGVGAPPMTWPPSERTVDVLHKAVFSVVTGVVTDRVLPPTLSSTRGRTSH